MQQDVSPQVTQSGSSFRLEEATIDDLHRAIVRERQIASKWFIIISRACAPSTASRAPL
jgi:hypothetical protein